MTAPTTQLMPEARFRAALAALARAGERASASTFGGLYFGDLNVASPLALAQLLQATRTHLVSDWAQATSLAQRMRLLDIAEDIAARFKRRNTNMFNWWTPGQILDEIRETDTEVRSVGRDLYTQFIRPFEAAQDQAEADFRARRGREPTSDADYREVYAAMGVKPGDVEQHAFHGDLIKQWRAFLNEWDTFKARRDDSWYNRFWGNTGDQVVRYRERVIAWRARLAQAGVSLTTPTPKTPNLSAVPWEQVTGVLALVAGILIAPPLVSALTKKG